MLWLLTLHAELRKLLFGGHPVFYAFGKDRPTVKEMDVSLFLRLWEYEASLTTQVIPFGTEKG